MRAAKASIGGKGGGEREAGGEGRITSPSRIAADENGNVSPSDRMVESFKGGLVNRVRQRERDSRLVDDAAQRSLNGGGQYVMSAAGAQSSTLMEVSVRGFSGC